MDRSVITDTGTEIGQENSVVGRLNIVTIARKIQLGTTSIRNWIETTDTNFTENNKTSEKEVAKQVGKFYKEHTYTRILREKSFYWTITLVKNSAGIPKNCCIWT